MTGQNYQLPIHTILMRGQLDDTLIILPVWPDDIYLSTLSITIAPEVHHLLELGFKGSETSIPAFSEWWTALISDSEFDPALCFVLKDKDGIIGYAQCWTSSFIKDLVIHPKRRKQGLGNLLLQQIFHDFKERGFKTVELKVLSNNIGAIKLYTSSGMQII